MFFYKRTREVCTRQRGPGCFTTTLTKHCLTPRPQYGLYFYYRTGWITKHASRFERVIAPSADAKDRLARAGFEPEQVVVMPYFCPVIPAEQPRPIPQTKTITFIGRMAPNKGGEYFIEALGKLPDSVQGIMVGNITDGSESDVRELARQHGCQNRLTLRRWASQDEIVHILNRTSVFVFPSLWPETLGIVGLEALARGVPVVASDIGGVREWLEDSVNGLLVEPGSAGQIHDAVIALVEDERKLFAYGEKGIETVNSKILPAFHTEQLVRLYEQIVSNN
jgi:glycosyltransferase involved in cell wall biosynthesis